MQQDTIKTYLRDIHVRGDDSGKMTRLPVCDASNDVHKDAACLGDRDGIIIAGCTAWSSRGLLSPANRLLTPHGACLLPKWCDGGGWYLCTYAHILPLPCFKDKAEIRPLQESAALFILCAHAAHTEHTGYSEPCLSAHISPCNACRQICS